MFAPMKERVTTNLPSIHALVGLDSLKPCSANMEYATKHMSQRGTFAELTSAYCAPIVAMQVIHLVNFEVLPDFSAAQLCLLAKKLSIACCRLGR
jgi:hypothetical protein